MIKILNQKMRTKTNQEILFKKIHQTKMINHLNRVNLKVHQLVHKLHPHLSRIRLRFPSFQLILTDRFTLKHLVDLVIKMLLFIKIKIKIL